MGAGGAAEHTAEGGEAKKTMVFGVGLEKSAPCLHKEPLGAKVSYGCHNFLPFPKDGFLAGRSTEPTEQCSNPRLLRSHQ